MKMLRYLIEAFFAHVLLFIFWVLPPSLGSAFGGAILGTIGPHMGATKTARKNLERALPGKSPAEYDAILKGMWNNLGRVIAEYAHLKCLGRDRVEFVNREIFQAALDDPEKGAIFAGAHLGNWELSANVVARQCGDKANITYRAPNNPYVEALLQRCRTASGTIKAHPKSRESGRKLMQAMKDKEYIGFLLDQKYNEGVDVPFFGHPAMTNPVAVQMAQKYDVPLIPTRCERLDGARFRVTFYPPLVLKDEGGEALPVETVLGQLHILFEDWITERPEQWLWLHKRWRE